MFSLCIACGKEAEEARGRGNFDYALPQLNKLLSHLLFKCFYACVCVGVRVCGWKGHPKLGQVFGARRHHFKSQLSRTHAKAANTLVTSVCARVCVCVLDHVPRPMLYVCVCVCLPLYARLELFVCVWFGCFNPFRFAINSFCLFTFRLCRQQKSWNTL